MNIISQGLVLFVNRNDFILKEDGSDKSWWLSVIGGILCFAIGGWLSMKSIAPSKCSEVTQKVIEVLFIMVVLTLQFLLIELYLIDFRNCFWTSVHAVLLVLLTEKYIKDTRIGVTA